MYRILDNLLECLFSFAHNNHGHYIVMISNVRIAFEENNSPWRMKQPWLFVLFEKQANLTQPEVVFYFASERSTFGFVCTFPCLCVSYTLNPILVTCGHRLHAEHESNI